MCFNKQGSLSLYLPLVPCAERDTQTLYMSGDNRWRSCSQGESENGSASLSWVGPVITLLQRQAVVRLLKLSSLKTVAEMTFGEKKRF